MLSVLNVKFQISDVIELHKIYVCSYVHGKYCGNWQNHYMGDVVI